ncbi:ATP-binding protein [Aquabacterium sp. J223]|uniref:ATP-binding protein n=1 Tax=Aquabacterium sp. J223 TaxID=2898431 RepID=UPI0021AD645E|nr:ATP-binding protein [Aquabacterium sp. J223]UUX95287.1 ATP-binding protein [Aquabacterium sp. J223]
MTDSVQDSAVALPTKRFFVSMLKRDIDLKDAIVDLVDNCLDGALRSAGVYPADYAKHSIEIEVGRAALRIADDCGGIPREIAKNYAFKMGRERADPHDSESETIGMHGIGMKRAIPNMVRTGCPLFRWSRQVQGSDLGKLAPTTELGSASDR